jgi:hypothetical protein
MHIPPKLNNIFLRRKTGLEELLAEKLIRCASCPTPMFGSRSRKNSYIITKNTP